jgi:trigger factor
MKVSLVEETAVKKALDFEVDPDVVEKELEKQAKAIGRKAQLPGFRPGKVPTAVVRRQFKQEVEQEALEAIANRALPEELESRGLKPVAQPRLVKADLHSGALATFRIAFDVLPAVEIPGWRGVEVRVPRVAASDEMVDREIDRLRDSSARFEPAPDRPAERGDFVEADIEITDHTSGQSRKRDEALVEVGGEGNHDELNAALEGVRPGDAKSVRAVEKETEKDGDSEKERIVRTVDYAFTVRAVKVKTLPARDDEFAKDMEFESLDEMRSKVRERIELALRRNQDAEIEDAVLTKVAAMTSFELPESLVEEQLRARVNRFAEMLQRQGVSLDKVRLDWDKIAAEQRPGAEKQVRVEILLDAIARAERVEATEGDLDEQVKRLAQRAGVPPDAVAARMKPEQRAQMAAQARDRRTIEMIKSAARVVEE